MKLSVIAKKLSIVAIIYLAVGLFLPQAALATTKECTDAGGDCGKQKLYGCGSNFNELTIICTNQADVCCVPKPFAETCQGPCKDSCDTQGGEFEDSKATNCPNQKCCVKATLIPEGGPCTEDSTEITLQTTVTTAPPAQGTCKAACIGDEKPVQSAACKDTTTPTCCLKPPSAEAAAPAAKATKGSPTELENLLGEGATFFTVINRVIKAFLGMVGALALAVFVYAGVLWMTAGSSDRVKQAQDTMKYAVIGLALIGFSYVITTFFFKALIGAGGGASKPAAQDFAKPAPENPKL